MNLNKIRISYFNKNVLTRSHSAAVETLYKRLSGHQCVDNNGMNIITINPAVTTSSKIVAVFRGGSRHETYNTKGMNHMFRRNFGLSSTDITPVSIVRHFQQMGGDAKCIGTREALIYSFEFGKTLTESAVVLLSQATTNQVFYDWELRDHVLPQMNVDYEYLIRKDFDTLCSELLHKAAYGDGLGNSLIVNPTRMNDFTLEDITKFADQTYSAGNVTLIGISIDAEKLLHLVPYFHIRPMVDMNQPEQRWCGGDLRRELPLDLARVMVVWECPGFNFDCELVAVSILSYALDNGVGKNILWNNGEQEMLRKLDKCIDVREANCILNMYSDSGLFGFTLAGCRNDSYHTAIKLLVEHFKNIGENGISKECFEQARDRLLKHMIMNGGSREALIDMYISQNALGDNSMSICDMFDLVENTTHEVVNEVAKSMFTSHNMAMASVGDLRNVPYLEELNSW